MKELTERFEKENKKAKIGEKLFYNDFLLSPERFPYIDNKECLDVSDIWQFQNIDVDLLFRNKEKKRAKIKEIINESHWLEKLFNNENDFTFYEIKIDTIVSKSRNLLYEVIKKDKPGRTAKSKADILVYIPLTSSLPHRTYDYYWIVDMFKLRKYIREEFHKEFYEFKELATKLANKILNKNIDINNSELQNLSKQILEFKHTIVPYNYCKPKNSKKMTKKQEEAANIDTNILNLWVNIDKLIELGIAEELKFKLSKEKREEIENEYKYDENIE